MIVQKAAGVERQIRLPLSKAAEIAYKSIRLRLSRSLLVTSGIVLAMAFLTSILVSDQLTTGMRTWAVTFPGTVEANRLSAQLEELRVARFAPLDAELHAASDGLTSLPNTVRVIDVQNEFGDSLAGLQRSVGRPLPAGEVELTNYLSLHPEKIAVMRSWLEAASEMQRLRLQLTAPQRLQQQMRNSGVPSTPSEIRNDQVQTRWLISLALLVAFVGILNAMLMSVTERFREIGTMKCLGALDGFILKLFLIESLLQGAVGGIAGVALGLGLSAASLSSTYGSYVWRNVPWQGLIGAVVICACIGMVLSVCGAIYPAWHAARMHPIEAMRVDT